MKGRYQTQNKGRQGGWERGYGLYIGAEESHKRISSKEYAGKLASVSPVIAGKLCEARRAQMNVKIIKMELYVRRGLENVCVLLLTMTWSARERRWRATYSLWVLFYCMAFL